MKIQPAHLEHMRAAISALPASRVEAIRATIASDPRVKDAAKRFRWDLCYAAGLSQFLCDAVYPYADDTHIDTALRHLVQMEKLT